MLHNHFIVFDMEQLRAAKLADPGNPNLTDGGQHSLFEKYMRDVYHRFFDTLDLRVLQAVPSEESRFGLTGYPQGLPSWEVQGGVEALKTARFWYEYDDILKGFIDFYNTFFTQVSSRNADCPADCFFPQQVENTLLFDNCFLRAAKQVREQCMRDAKYANSIRWKPAFKQLIYRNDKGKLIVTISGNSIGNAITELLGVVVKRVPDAAAYELREPRLLEHLLEVRRRMVDFDLGTPLKTPHWDKG
jgi:hypothetical protein